MSSYLSFFKLSVWAVMICLSYRGLCEAAPPSASVWTEVNVPSALASAPFDTKRYLKIPPNFTISVYARLSSPRFMAFAPNGDLFVSQPWSGKVMLIRPNGTDVPLVLTYVEGLRLPHDIVFHQIGKTTYVYIAESHQISRYVYNYGDTNATGQEVVVGNLPDDSSPELQGSYGHQLKNITLDDRHSLYVSIASATNDSISDAYSNPVRSAIYKYRANGTSRLFAQGLRNAEGLAMVPGTRDLWAVVNHRDEIAYPYHADITGDGNDDYGAVIPTYVDNHPPEAFVHVRPGAHYGWPFANPNPDTANGFNNMPFDPDYYNNPGWSVYSPTLFTPIDKGIPAHAAPLGLTFLQNTAFPEVYRNGVVVALHGSWNRQRKSGYKVVYFPWRPEQRPGRQQDLASGWLDRTTQQNWGRPVDTAVDALGNLYISDDGSDTIYKLTYTSG